jgi:hypothetical protein
MPQEPSAAAMGKQLAGGATCLITVRVVQSKEEIRMAGATIDERARSNTTLY